VRSLWWFSLTFILSCIYNVCLPVHLYFTAVYANVISQLYRFRIVTILKNYKLATAKAIQTVFMPCTYCIYVSENMCLQHTLSRLYGVATYLPTWIEALVRPQYFRFSMAFQCKNCYISHPAAYRELRSLTHPRLPLLNWIFMIYLTKRMTLKHAERT